MIYLLCEALVKLAGMVFVIVHIEWTREQNRELSALPCAYIVRR